MDEPVALRCPSCSAPLTKDGFDRDRGIATCGSCGALMSLPRLTDADASRSRSRAPVPLPPHVAVERLPDGVEIRRRWFTPSVLFLAFFCLFWDGFLVVWYALAFTKGAPLFAILFPLIHVSVGVGLTYTTVATICNTTLIRVGGGSISVAHGPVPWPGKRTISSGDVDQLWCKDVVRNGKNGPVHSYEVWAATNDGKSSRLVGSGLESAQALFIEQEVEHALGVVDRPMAGEMAR